MSRLRRSEFPLLVAAQVRAASSVRYKEWSDWMRKAFSFSVAMRMVEAMGCDKPGMGWYLAMKHAGTRIMEGLNATERGRYAFRGNEIGDGETGERKASVHSPTGRTSPAGHSRLLTHRVDRNVHYLQNRDQSASKSA